MVGDIKNAITSTAFVLMAFVFIPEITFGDDIIPPELVEFDFTPKIVDTSEAPSIVTFMLRVIDDLSGFQYVQLHMISPSMRQEMYEFWYGSGELDYTFQVSVEFPQDSELGTWFINNLALVDKVGNRRDISTQELSDLGFQTTIEVISNPDDIIPPELVEFDFTPKIVDTSEAQATVTFMLRVIDYLSGFQYAQLHMISPSMGQEIYKFWFGSGELDYTFQASVEFPQYSEVGTWFIKNIALLDKVGNRRDISTQELSNLGFPTELLIIENQALIKIIGDNVQELPPEAFDKNPEERKESFSEKLTDIATNIDNGDLNAAIHQLENLRTKMDGCFGGLQQNDWITDCEAQEMLLSQIDALIAYLRTL